jgi:hypothetical protein
MANESEILDAKVLASAAFCIETIKLIGGSYTNFTSVRRVAVLGQTLW